MSSSMSSAEAVATPLLRRGVSPPVILLVGSIALYVGVALSPGQSMMLHLDGIVGLLQRMVGLGLVAVGQTFAILAGSIDLRSSQSHQRRGGARVVHQAQGRPEMMLPAVAAVLTVSAVVGVINGALIYAIARQSADRDAGRRAFPARHPLGELHQFRRVRAEGIPGGRLWNDRLAPFSVIGAFRSRAARLASSLRATKFGAHLYAVGGNSEGCFRLAGIRTDFRDDGRARATCSVCAGLTGLYLASHACVWRRPWVGRDGVYDLESIAVVVIGGTVLAGGRGGVWGTLAGVLLFAVLDVLVQHDWRLGLSRSSSCAARS